MAIDLTLPNVEAHWAASSKEFFATYAPWCSAYADLLNAVGGILATLEGRRQLADNCAYLMLSKAVNHSLAAYVLITRGLVVDAALSTRNCLETLLLVQLCVLDPSESLFAKWSNGHSFKPSWVRKKLDELEEVTVRNVVVSKPSLEGAFATAYRWLSEVTHANLASLDESVVMHGTDRIEVAIGGSKNTKETTVNFVFSVACFTLLITAVLCGSVFSLKYIENNKDILDKLSKKIDQTIKSYLSETGKNGNT
jgi:hypothetical protein